MIKKETRLLLYCSQPGTFSEQLLPPPPIASGTLVLPHPCQQAIPSAKGTKNPFHHDCNRKN